MSAEKEVGCQTHSIKGNYNGLEMFKCQVCHHAQSTTEEHQSLLLRLPGWLQQHCRYSSHKAERVRDAGDVCGTEIKAGDFLKQCVQTEESLCPVRQSMAWIAWNWQQECVSLHPHACACTPYTQSSDCCLKNIAFLRTMSDRPSLKHFLI